MKSDPIHLWIVDTGALKLDGELERLLALLPRAEREKTLRFIHREDRLRRAAGRLMIRALAAREMGYADVPVRLAEFGKPYFAREYAPCFNLSHSGRLVVLAWGDASVGVDVEKHAPVDWREISRAFSEAERALLNASANSLDCFYRLWTIREAFSKEEGVGLSIFENHAVAIDDERGKIRFGDRELCFRCWKYPEYTVSVCAERLKDVRVERLTETDWKCVLAENGYRNGQDEEMNGL